ncbi:MAG: hypothetical protein FP813_08960 [Desulfurivibrio sp.]|nr:hypothetical protein [Desulfurivibrio sp.]MBU4034405.1 hypothetical protein [Pseudomonadota bacterium]MBU4119405.1 hypothetical protein [Pseudomonadota bacterium]
MSAGISLTVCAVSSLGIRETRFPLVSGRTSLVGFSGLLGPLAVVSLSVWGANPRTGGKVQPPTRKRMVSMADIWAYFFMVSPRGLSFGNACKGVPLVDEAVNRKKRSGKSRGEKRWLKSQKDAITTGIALELFFFLYESVKIAPAFFITFTASEYKDDAH